MNRNGDFKATVRSRYRRTDGSQDQRLVLIPDEQAVPEGCYPGVLFQIVQKGDELFFSKKREDLLVEAEEAGLLQQAEGRNVIPLKHWSDEFGLVFPYLSHYASLSLTADYFDEIFLDEVRALVERLKEADVFYKIDLHSANIMVMHLGDSIIDWRLIDLEPMNNNRNDQFMSDLERATERCKTQNTN